MRSADPAGVICDRGSPLDVIVELSATWVTAARHASLPGYVCVVSRRHVIEPHELVGRDRVAFWDDVSAVAKGVQHSTRSAKLNYEIHGNTVRHLHVHIYPRYPGDPFEGSPIDPHRGPAFERSGDDLDRLREAILRETGGAASG